MKELVGAICGSLFLLAVIAAVLLWEFILPTVGLLYFMGWLK